MNGVALAVSGEDSYIFSLHPACSGQYFNLNCAHKLWGRAPMPPATVSRLLHDRLSAGGLKTQVAYQLSPQWGFAEEIKIRERLRSIPLPTDNKPIICASRRSTLTTPPRARSLRTSVG